MTGAVRAQTTEAARRDPVVYAMASGFRPDPWQAAVLRSRHSRLLLNCTRQGGKSTVASYAVSHLATFKAASVQLLVSPSLRQSSLVFAKVRDVLKRSPFTPEIVEENKLSVKLANGSQIFSLPGSEDTIRGYTADRIIEDEAAFVDDGLNTAIRPMLAVSGGALWLMSTPNGRRGDFFDAWENGARWEKHSVRAVDVPRIPAEFLEEERRAMGARYAQEYECAFIEAATGRVYHAYDSALCCVDKAPALTYHVIGIDYGVVDDTAFTVLGWRDHDPCVYVLESYRMQRTSPSDAAEEAKRLEDTYRPVKIVGDVGGMGKGFAEEARRRFTLPIEPAQKQNKAGYIALLNGDLARGRVKVLRSTCGDLTSEWLTLPWGDNRMKEAPGYDNHAADSCLYAWRAASAYHEAPEAPRPEGAAALEKWEAELLEAEDTAQKREWWAA